MPSPSKLLLLLLLIAYQSQEEEFGHGRLENLCEGAQPICGPYAGCALEEDELLSGRFPGARRVIIPAKIGQTRLRVRLLFTEMVYPGTELLLLVRDLNSGRVEQLQLLDVDIFDRAGDDSILDLEVEFSSSKGDDRLLEIFSDLSASWLLIVELEED